jgi:hypothetical protein
VVTDRILIGLVLEFVSLEKPFRLLDGDSWCYIKSKVKGEFFHNGNREWSILTEFTPKSKTKAGG